MRLEYKDYEKYFEDYCNRFGLNFDLVKTLPKSIGPDDIAILYSDGKSGERGMLDDTPLPPVLILSKGRGRTGFWIEQTEFTDKYTELWL
jgi:hypothetical protein